VEFCITLLNFGKHVDAVKSSMMLIVGKLFSTRKTCTKVVSLMQLIAVLHLRSRVGVWNTGDVFAAHGMSGDFLRLTQIVSTNVHKINQNGKGVFILFIINNSCLLHGWLLYTTLEHHSTRSTETQFNFIVT